jgi:hypothetical protein
MLLVEIAALLGMRLALLFLRFPEQLQSGATY